MPTRVIGAASLPRLGELTAGHAIRAIFQREQNLCRLPNNLVGGPAENCFCARRPVHDEAGQVRHDDGMVPHALNDPLVPFLALPQRTVAGAQLVDHRPLVAGKLVLDLRCAAQPHQVGHVLDPMNDQFYIAVSVQHRRVDGAPPPFHELPARVADRVALQLHHVRRSGRDHALERGREIANAICCRVARIVRENLEQRPADLILSPRVRDPQSASFAATMVQCRGATTRNGVGDASNKAL